MRLETLLPLGKVDPGLRAPDIPLDIWSVARDAALLEEIGYGGLVVEETKDDPFTLLALAAQATTDLRLGTSVTIAFPRSPTVMALSAWTLQKLSRGRFTLGLGTQVRGHIQRRYGVTWHPPAPWMREYTQAVRAVWDCWQNGTRLDFQGEHYRLDLMVPLFNAGPIEHPASRFSSPPSTPGCARWPGRWPTESGRTRYARPPNPVGDAARRPPGRARSRAVPWTVSGCA